MTSSPYEYSAPVDESDAGAANWFNSDTDKQTGIRVFPETTYARVYLSADGSMVFGRIPKSEVPALATALLRAVGLEEDAMVLEDAMKKRAEKEKDLARRNGILTVIGAGFTDARSLASDSIAMKAVNWIIELEDKLAEKN